MEDLISDDELETLTEQILKFFADDPLTPDELSAQIIQVAEWSTQAKLNHGLFRLVLAGELAMGFHRKTMEPQFKKLSSKVANEPAPIADLEEDEEDWGSEWDSNADWWETYE